MIQLINFINMEVLWDGLLLVWELVCLLIFYLGLKILDLLLGVKLSPLFRNLGYLEVFILFLFLLFWLLVLLLSLMFSISLLLLLFFVYSPYVLLLWAECSLLIMENIIKFPSKVNLCYLMVNLIEFFF
jgi:hypothetical protein